MPNDLADKIFLSIIEEPIPIQSVRKRIHLAKTWLTNLFYSEGKSKEENGEYVDEIDTNWLKNIQATREEEKDSVWAAITKTNFSEIFEVLEKKVREVNPLVLFIPILLPTNEVENLVRKVRADMGRPVLLDIRLDPDLIGGAAIAWNGIYKDYSLRQKIKDNHETILASFQKYIR